MAVHAHINTVPSGSTGGIMMKEHRELLASGEDSYAFWGRGRDAMNDHEMKFATDFEIKLDVLKTRLDGKAGFHSVAATKRLLKRLDEIKPDVIHLHNMHGYYVNVRMLFEWLGSHDCEVKWTLHDCWAFTGHCAYFSYVKCDQWMTHCALDKICPQLHTYPKTYARNSCAKNYEEKKEVFARIPRERMTLITPSKWLERLVGISFLSNYPTEVRHNTIDTGVFRPCVSDFREKYGVGTRFLILGVASPWSERKGLRDFVSLSTRLDGKRFSIALVGLDDDQVRSVPDSIIALKRTESVEELAKIYSAADVLFNPTYEDNFPTVNLEAEACGTPVVTYDTGGSPETLHDPKSKVVANLDEAVDYFIGRCCLE